MEPYFTDLATAFVRGRLGDPAATIDDGLKASLPKTNLGRSSNDWGEIETRVCHRVRAASSRPFGLGSLHRDDRAEGGLLASGRSP